jgi:L-threonylcarbamoyladenylate synthase
MANMKFIPTDPSRPNAPDVEDFHWDRGAVQRALGEDRYMTAHQFLQNPEKALYILKAGGIIIVPTDTLYGLAVRSSDEAALEKLFRLKGRSLERQVPLLIENPEKTLSEIVDDLSDSVKEMVQKLVSHFWPGPLTLVLPAKKGLSRLITGNTQAVGLRQAAHPVVRTLLRVLGEPITGTSANLAGAQSPFRLEQISSSVLEKVDLVIDGGTLSGQMGSTVLDLSGPEMQILRQGDLSLNQIREVIKY